MKIVKIQTHANISLNKYWGKRDEKLFLPTKSSLTISLSELKTTTFIQKLSKLNFFPESNKNLANNQDVIYINGTQPLDIHRQKILVFLNFFRRQYGIKDFFKISTTNNFPTAAGLASSSSGFAALALGLDKVCNLGLGKKELSILARQGSGSACRSIEGGFVLWHKGIALDGNDSYAEQIFDHTHWHELCIIVVVVKTQTKFIGSREGMRMTVSTSKYYNTWLEKSAQRLPLLIRAIEKRDFTTIGQLTQNDWQDMQQVMLDTTPQLNYWTEESYKVINTIRKLCQKGLECYFTTEAGPNIKVLCLENNQNKIRSELEKISGIIQIIPCKIASNPTIEILNSQKNQRKNNEIFNI